MKRERIEQHDVFLSAETVNHFRAVNSALRNNLMAREETEKVIEQNIHDAKLISQRMRETR